MPNAIPYDRPTRQLIAVTSQCDERTVIKYLTGGRVRPIFRDSIARALQTDAVRAAIAQLPAPTEPTPEAA